MMSWEEVINPFTFMEGLGQSKVNKKLIEGYSATMPLFKHSSGEAFLQYDYPTLETESVVFVYLICKDVTSALPHLVHINESVDVDIDNIIVTIQEADPPIRKNNTPLAIRRKRRFFKP